VNDALPFDIAPVDLPVLLINLPPIAKPHRLDISKLVNYKILGR
jgi:hypothetical protein